MSNSANTKQRAYQNLKKELEALQHELATVQEHLLQAHQLVQTAQQFSCFSASL
jgi:hypothetical protein